MYVHMNACPMKPNKYKYKENPRYGRQEKFKGIRAFMFVTDSGSHLCTRGGHYVEQNFKHLADVRTKTGTYVLDGELWQCGVEDEVIAGWANSKYLTDNTSGVLFQAFDIVEYLGEDLTESLPLEQRDVLRARAVEAIGHPSVVYVPYLTDPARDYFAEIVSRGGEGVMYKNLDSIYTQRDGDNRPANHWYKQKSVLDFDVVTMGYDLGKGKYDGMLGAIRYGQYVDGELIYLGTCSGITDQLREQLTLDLRSDDRLVFEVRAAAQDPNSGALIEPRFIRFRTDKQPSQCIWEKTT